MHIVNLVEHMVCMQIYLMNSARKEKKIDEVKMQPFNGTALLSRENSQIVREAGGTKKR